MNWRLKRQLIAIGIAGLAAAIVVFGLFFWFSATAPSNDGVGLTEAPQPLRLIWTRFFLVRPGVYDVAALVENPNERVRAAAFSYIFRLFDEHDILIATKEGIGALDPAERFVTIEPLLATGVRVPKRVSFEIRDAAWEAETKIILPVVVTQKRFSADIIDTVVRVTLANADIRGTQALDVVAVLADADGNAAAAAAARIEPLAAGKEREVIFTWPRALPEPKVIEVYVRERL